MMNIIKQLLGYFSRLAFIVRSRMPLEPASGGPEYLQGKSSLRPGLPRFLSVFFTVR
jgi:hypothetical protein